MKKILVIATALMCVLWVYLLIQDRRKAPSQFSVEDGTVMAHIDPALDLAALGSCEVDINPWYAGVQHTTPEPRSASVQLLFYDKENRLYDVHKEVIRVDAENFFAAKKAFLAGNGPKRQCRLLIWQ